MELREIQENKKDYLELLLLADEQESMIDRYLERGRLYVLEKEKKTVCVCVLTDEGNGTAEVKNLAVAPDCQRQGYGRCMLSQIEAICRKEGFAVLQVGTGDSPLTIPFYEACGFCRSHIVRNFFVDNYEKPIKECGKQLVDMIYLQKRLT